MDQLLFAACIVLLLLFLFWLVVGKGHEGMSGDIYQAGSMGITANSGFSAYEKTNVLGGAYPNLSAVLPH
jgi:hypothetical protein